MTIFVLKHAKKITSLTIGSGTFQFMQQHAFHTLITLKKQPLAGVLVQYIVPHLLKQIGKSIDICQKIGKSSEAQ